jgi:hypothetical protein
MASVLNSTQQEPGCNSGCINGGEKTAPNDASIDAYLIREMNELSVQERQKVLEEIHGVADVQEETPDMVAEALGELAGAMCNLPRSARRALDRAFFLKPSIEKDSKFKLMFLRADYYDAGKAAMRMAKFFEHKLELFGEDKLVKKITLEDLNEEELKILRFGSSMRLAEKDPTGRPILFIDPSRYILDIHDNMVSECDSSLRQWRSNTKSNG